VSVQLDDTPQRSVSGSARAADGAMTIVSPTGDIVSLNPMAAALWELCDGSTSVREVVEAATRLFAGPPDDIRRDILDTLDTLYEQRVLD
jgi:hypothetical protein